MQNRDGQWFQLRIRPYRALDNVIEGAVATFSDVTELCKARDALRDSSSLRHLAVVLRDAYDAVTAMDTSGNILAWNPGAEELYGWTEPEALQMNLRELVPAGRQREELARLQKVAQNEQLQPYSSQRLTKDGRMLSVWIPATALHDDVRKTYAIATTERARTQSKDVGGPAPQQQEQD